MDNKNKIIETVVKQVGGSELDLFNNLSQKEKEEVMGEVSEMFKQIKTMTDGASNLDLLKALKELGNEKI